MREDSDRLNRIVESLLDIGRIEAGRALMDLRAESAQQLVTSATEPMTAAFHDKGVDLTVDVPAEISPVMVDQTRIGHVFSNLLTNALKYTPPGGRVGITAVEDGRFVRFTVEDSGCGIPRQYLDRIFERFFRVPGQSGGTGAGLGLAITKEIVEAHGGRIEVASTESVGSKFTFTLQRGDAPPSLASGHAGNGRRLGQQGPSDRGEMVRS